MSHARASLALVPPALAPSAGARERPGPDRRAHVRLSPRELTARLKYGEQVRLLDVSVGGALLETSRVLRPDTDLVLEFLDARSREIVRVVSRVLRAQVAGIDGGIRYRGACAFRRPLAHPALAAAPIAAAPPPVHPDARDFLKLEFALKAIAEGTQPNGGRQGSHRLDHAALIEALGRVRLAAERRGDPLDAHLDELLAVVIAALRRSDSRDAIVDVVQAQLARQLPVLGLRATPGAVAPAADRELVTLTIPTGADPNPLALTAEFPSGFAPDEMQYRLLKAATYLVGMAGTSTAATERQGAPVAVSHTVVLAPSPSDEGELPVGWHRVVVRHLDGKILRGYSNDFHPERAHMHVCPTVQCPANERLLVPLSRLKAVFFVKTLQGDAERVDDQTFDPAPGARKVEVTFRDGEVMLGTTLSYKPNGHGFLLHPANARGNNIRTYVLTSAIRHMRFL